MARGSHKYYLGNLIQTLPVCRWSWLKDICEQSAYQRQNAQPPRFECGDPWWAASGGLSTLMHPLWFVVTSPVWGVLNLQSHPETPPHSIRSVQAQQGAARGWCHFKMDRGVLVCSRRQQTSTLKGQFSPIFKTHIFLCPFVLFIHLKQCFSLTRTLPTTRLWKLLKYLRVAQACCISFLFCTVFC